MIQSAVQALLFFALAVIVLSAGGMIFMFLPDVNRRFAR
jgi:preprotein translocase subunit SecY